MKNGTVLVLRTTSADRTSHSGFKWPEKGKVKASDWSPKKVCGQGLHGLLWGEGDSSLLNWNEDAKWFVVRVKASDVVDLDGKVKFPGGTVEYCGERGGAVSMIMAENPGAIGCVGAILGSTGYRGSASATGYLGSASATGDRGSASATGYRGSASATDHGYLLLSRWDEKAKRYRITVLYPGEDGIKPDTWYRLGDDGKALELGPVKDGWQDRVKESGVGIAEGTR